MVRFWQQIIRGERGQALPIVLALLVLGGLLIVPSLNYASTSLSAGQTVKKNVRGVYAADAGIEYTIRRIKNFASFPTQLPENVNQMQVAIQAENLGPYTLAYYGIILGVSGKHYDYLTVTGEIGPLTEGAYPYTITVTLNPEITKTIQLNEVGVRLPVGYGYEPGSAADPVDNFSAYEPISGQDAAGAQLLSWKLEGPERPVLKAPDNLIVTQTFNITGTGELGGDYTWVVTNETDIGTVGEVTGILYRITATATRPGDGEVTGKIRADVIHDEGTGVTRIIYWQINPQ